MKPSQIDNRTFKEIVDQILGDTETGSSGLRKYYTPEWTSTNENDPGVVLTNLFARLMEILIVRLNMVPDKNFVAFLDMLGVERLPGNPARAPVTFILSEGSINGGLVPKGTQVATVQTEDTEAILFETEKSMYATPTKLQKVFSINPQKDKYEDHTQVALGMETGSFKIFGNDSVNDPLIDHILYLAHDQLFAYTEPVELILTFTMNQDFSSADYLLKENWDIVWERYIKVGKEIIPDPITPKTDETQRFTTNKTLKSVNFKDFSGTEKTTQSTKAEGGGEAYWIRCRLTKPIPSRSNILPEIDMIKATIQFTRNNLYPELLFFNNIEIDYVNTGLNFYPLGEKPKLNDSLYIGNNEVFSKKDADIVVKVELLPGTSPNPSELIIKWEYWAGNGWKEIPNISGYNEDGSDNSDVLKFIVAKGDIKFKCPETKANEINGQSNFWIRARIIAGNYGKPDHYEKNNSGFIYVESDLVPPSIASLKLSYNLDKLAVDGSIKCLTYNDFTYIDKSLVCVTPDSTFPPFTQVIDEEQSLYLGFDKAFGDNSISIYFVVVENLTLSVSGNENGVGTSDSNSAPPIVFWEYYNSANKWGRLEVEDSTTNFMTRGTVTFIGPSDFTKTKKFGYDLFWLRARLESGAYDFSPQLTGVYLNTILASNVITVEDEIIGSSTGEKNQSFNFSHSPILRGEKIYIKELEMPSEKEIAVIEEDAAQEMLLEEGRELTEQEKEDLIKTVKNEITGEEEIWVKWHRVNNFLNSVSNSRHFILDRILGTLSFGDDANGMIPPVGKDNIKADFYQSGGGVQANKAATKNAIKELKSSLPYIDKVYNVDAASGGSEAETMEKTKERGPQTIKHRDRAVATEDFVWLARESSTQIALTKCLSTTNDKLEFEPGSVTIIIVPESDDPKPLPSYELTRLVKNYLTERALSTVVNHIYVLGPGYSKISVKANVIPKYRDEANIIEGKIVNNLRLFFHPLKGGPDGNGWDFGRSVYISEVYSVIESTEGVDYVESVVINDDPFLEEVLIDQNSLVYSGEHEINIV